ncbi:MAG: hypothetical protein JJE15_11435 [Desulfobacteraceae bacterium]|nr:hypothetical protein [Desulfobacteraceae bacterium]
MKIRQAAPWGSLSEVRTGMPQSMGRLDLSSPKRQFSVKLQHCQAQKAAVAEKVDLPACPDIAKRPRGY